MFKLAQGKRFSAGIGSLSGYPVIHPNVMTMCKVPIDIELTGMLTLGMTVADFRFPIPADCHTQVALKRDQTAFMDLIVDALERIGEVEV
ncbi:Inosine-uridine preferring nucleoside hydrolase [Serratia fonticola AU-P3(3)]|nr:Inosine-uridine preferring nucleoside hydrolase [Serratia fonticola AU-P3(3)]